MVYQVVYLEKSADLKCTPCVKIIQIKATRVNSIEKFLKGKVWCNINSPFGINITCSIDTILNPHNNYLSLKTIV